MTSKKKTAVPLNTFIVRFWLKPAGSMDHWHGQIQHIQTGEQLSFAQEKFMLTFIQRWVKMNENDTEKAVGD